MTYPIQQPKQIQPNIGVAPAILCGAALLLAGALPAQGALSATAELSTSQSSAPYTYTISLHNTGDTNIGTLWFAWTDVPGDYNFLPSAPISVVAPSGWVAPVTHNLFPGDGYGIEYYDISGNPLLPGQTLSTFQFTTNDSPAQLAGNAYFPSFKVTHSVVYIGYPEYDPGYALVISVPEPASMALTGLVVLAGLRRRR